jgi:O-antigen/teichoic acid export membrane protein
LYKNIFFITLGRIAENLVTLVALAGIARLGSEVLGTFYFARGVGIQVTIFSDFGLSRFVIQRLAKNPQSYGDVFGSLLLMRIFLCVFAFLICWSVFASFPFEALTVEASLMLAGSFLVFSIADLLLDGLRAREEMHTPVLLTSLQRILFTSMTL